MFMLLEDLVREHILSVLEDHEGSRTKAALALGIANRTLRHKLSKYKSEGYSIPEASWAKGLYIPETAHPPVVVDIKEEDLEPQDPEYNYFATNTERLRYLDTRRRL